MTDAHLDHPRHPLGLTDHPSWHQVRIERERLYLAERARRYPPVKPTLAERCAAWLRGCFA